jgi:Zinc knuckle
MFRRGLKRPLATAIVERMHPRPQTLQQWYQSARAHHAAYAENKAMFANPFLRHDRNKWEQALKSKGKSWRRNNDAMDVDAIDTSGTSNKGAQQPRGQYNRTTFLTNEERKMLLKERRCFNCRAQGHMSKQCPKKGKAVTTAPTIRTCHGSKGPWLEVSTSVTCSAQVLSDLLRRREGSQAERSELFLDWRPS